MCNMEHETEQLRPLNDYKTYYNIIILYYHNISRLHYRRGSSKQSHTTNTLYFVNIK